MRIAPNENQGKVSIDVVELTGNIENLRNTLDIDQQAMLATISREERRALRISIERCTIELQRLLYQLITLPLEMDEFAFRPSGFPASGAIDAHA